MYLFLTIRILSITMGLCGLTVCDRLPPFSSSLSYPCDCPHESDSQAVKLCTFLLETVWKTTSFLGSSLLFHLRPGTFSRNASTTASSSRVFRKWMTGPRGRYWNSEMTSHRDRDFSEAGAAEGLLCGRGSERPRGEGYEGRLGDQQEQSHLHFLHFAIPEEGSHVQVLQSVGYLG